jgi:hypothetical protein
MGLQIPDAGRKLLDDEIAFVLGDAVEELT